MISIIIPVKNAEQTIVQSIDSVINQDVDDIEILCVINGTTDTTEDKIKSINDSRIKILHSTPGIVSALNEGLRASKGELIARQDADDIWHPQKLKKQLEIIQNVDVDILGTQLSIVDANNKFIRSSAYPVNNDEIIRNLISGNNAIGHPSVVFKKRILDKCAGYFDLFPFAEDLDLWVRCIPWYKFQNLNEDLVTYKHVHNTKYNPAVPRMMSSWYKAIYGVKND